MANHTNGSVAPKSDQRSESKAGEKPTSTRLCMFSAPLTVPEFFDQTRRYATDPRKYLEEVLGPEALEKRAGRLSIPSKVPDKDIYGGGDHKKNFEQHIANLLGKESGLFFITGVQAQLAALKVHCEVAKNNRVAWHVSSHLETAEERSFEKLYGLERVLLGSNDDELATVDEIKEVLALPEHERPAVVVLELPNRTLGCKTYTFHDLNAISNACYDANVKLHCDGARLWEIQPYYQQTASAGFLDIASMFNSVYVSFYKGMRGAAGAVLTGKFDLIEEAKIWQRRAGGTVVTLMYEVVDCERGYNENIGTFHDKWQKMHEVQEGILAATEKFKTKKGNKIVSFVADPATCCQARTMFAGFTDDELIAARDSVEQKTNVRVFERLLSGKTVDQRAKAERESNLEANGENVEGGDDEAQHGIEWMIGRETGKLETKVFADGYVALCEELLQIESKR